MAKTNFNTVYNDFYKRSFYFVKSYIHDDVIAEDIVSESLIKLWEQIKVKEIGNIKPLLFTILRNATLDHLKHQTVRMNAISEIQRKLNSELKLRISILESYDPSDIFSSEIQEIFQQTLRQLPPKTRRVIELSRLKFKSNKEIAEQLGISVKGVDYHIGVALKELRKQLKDYLPLVFFF